MRLLRLASIAACLLLVIPGCPGRNSGDSGVVTITFWHSFVTSTIPALNDLIQEFERAHPGIRIRAQYIPTCDGLIQKLITSVQSNTSPDVSWMSSKKNPFGGIGSAIAPDVGASNDRHIFARFLRRRKILASIASD